MAPSTRTRARGRWSVGYRFSGRPGDYPIRVRIRRRRGLPYVTGVSKRVTVGSIPATLGLGLQWVTDVGRHASPELSASLAQIAPVLFLAGLIENRAFGLLEADRGRTRADLEIAVMFVRWEVVLFLVAEGVALYSVAADTRTTFLVFTPCLAMLFMVSRMSSMTHVMRQRWIDEHR